MAPHYITHKLLNFHSPGFSGPNNFLVEFLLSVGEKIYFPAFCGGNALYLPTGAFDFHPIKKLERMDAYSHYPEPVVFQWQSSGNPVYLELGPQVYTGMPLERELLVASVLPVVFQWLSSGFPVCFIYAN